MSQFAVSRFCVHVESYSRKSTGKDCLDAKRALVRQPLLRKLLRLPSTTTTPGITTLLTIGNIAARLLFLRLTFRPLARLAQNEEPTQPERIKESSCLPWGNASRLNARIASNRAGRRHFPA